MDSIPPIAMVLSTFLALNMGANNSAASMGRPYGAGGRSKKEAVRLAEIVTSGIIGFSCTGQGFSVTAQNKHQNCLFWFVVPFFAVNKLWATFALF